MTACSAFPFTRTEQPPFPSSRFDTEQHPQTTAGAARTYRPLTPPAQPQARTDPCAHQTTLIKLGMPQQSATSDQQGWNSQQASGSHRNHSSQTGLLGLGLRTGGVWRGRRRAWSPPPSRPPTPRRLRNPTASHSQYRCPQQHSISQAPSNSKDRVVFTTEHSFGSNELGQKVLSHRRG